nr:hypothetical protein [Tanacetum cinerariifolium]
MLNKLIGGMILTMNLMIKNWKHTTCTWLNFNRFLQMLMTLDLSLTKSQNKKVQNDDHYDVFAFDCQHTVQSESVHNTYLTEQDAQNLLIESEDMNYDKVNNKLSEVNAHLYADYKKSKDELKRRNTIEYAMEIELECAKLRVQTMNMINNKCRTSFAKPEFLKKAKQANPRLYDIGCYNDNLALMLSPESEEVIRLEKESRSKLSDLVRPFDYANLNSLYDLFVPQLKKSSEQQFFSERSRISHINVQREKKKESFQKQTTFLETRMDESIPMNKKCQSSLEIVNIQSDINTIIAGVELCKQKIAKRTYYGHIDPFIQNTIEQNFCPVITKINVGLHLFLKRLNEEMVVDLRYFNSLELEVDSLTSQLETQKTQLVSIE